MVLCIMGYENEFMAVGWRTWLYFIFKKKYFEERKEIAHSRYFLE